MIPEFMVPRAAEETAKKAIVEFRDMFIAALEKVERAATETEKEKEKRDAVALSLRIATVRACLSMHLSLSVESYF